MADEVRVSGPGSNGSGDRLEVSVKDRAVRLASQQLPLLFVIVVLAGFGYFMSQNMIEGQRQGFAGLATILEKMNTYQTQNLDKMATNQQALLELVHTNRTQLMQEVGQQNQLVHEQTTALQKTVDEQTATLRRMLISINYNMGKEPSERIPVEFVPSELSRPEHQPRR